MTNVRSVSDVGAIAFTVGGETDEALVEAGLRQANDLLRGADINTAFTFAVSFLTSLIVIYEESVLGMPGQFDFDAFTEQMREAVKAGHGLPMRKPQ
jgi:hypothetical protein